MGSRTSGAWMRGALLWMATSCLGPLGGCGAPSASLRASTAFSRQVRSFSVSIEGGPALCPGQRAQALVTFLLQDGTWRSRPLTREEFTVRTRGAVSTDDAGGIVLERDPVLLEKAPPGMMLEMRDRPDLEPVALALPTRFNCYYAVTFMGQEGAPGTPGAAGTSGVPRPRGLGALKVGGHDARLVLLGSGGGAGGDGGRGGLGGPGPRVEMVVTRVPHLEVPRLKVLVRDLDSGRSERFLLGADLRGAYGVLNVSVRGGRGARSPAEERGPRPRSEGPGRGARQKARGEGEGEGGGRREEERNMDIRG